jgi:MFS family permease
MAQKILMLIIICYVVGTSLAGYATEIYIMLIIRSIQGVAVAIFPVAFKIIRDQFPVEKLSIGQSIVAAMYSAGSVVGLTVRAVVFSS